MVCFTFSCNALKASGCEEMVRRSHISESLVEEMASQAAARASRKTASPPDAKGESEAFA
jgi:hypothetical protein